MTISTLAFGKANASGPARKLLNLPFKIASATERPYGTGVSARPADGKQHAAARAAEDPSLQRDLFLNVLNANATKRDAKQYLARFSGQKTSAPPDPSAALSRADQERATRSRHDQDRLDRMGVNLGGLYAPARAIADSPQFARDPAHTSVAPAEAQTHVALVSLRDPESLDERTLEGLAVTLAQLVKLDMRIVLVLDSASHAAPLDAFALKQNVTGQALRLSRALEKLCPSGARFVPDALTRHQSELPLSAERPSAIEVSSPDLILGPLKRGSVPIVPTLAYTAEGRIVPTSMREVMLALTAELTGRSAARFSPEKTAYQYALDRIILLDQNGGIPSRDRGDGAHLFVNLEQEFASIAKDLRDPLAAARSGPVSASQLLHLENLHTCRDTLSLLPSSSSAVIITPAEAAASSLRTSDASSPIGAGTRPRKNTLIHNLLTNKPMVSPSLPLARLASSSPSEVDANVVTAPTTTLLKLGMPLTIIPGISRDGVGWTVPESGKTSLDLEKDPRIDLPRLVHLIENSFRRKLDFKDYASRISGRIAGLIIAGDYEGGAILTWESPSGASPSDPSSLVPYLDKFAVLQSSQGSAGVADIVFQAMVRSCFPGGVCWRSRRDNPVNKWYFERAAGTWSIPDSNWTMFWTGEGVVEDKKRWDEYVDVCTSVVPSWADGKRPD